MQDDRDHDRDHPSPQTFHDAATRADHDVRSFRTDPNATTTRSAASSPSLRAEERYDGSRLADADPLDVSDTRPATGPRMSVAPAPSTTRTIRSDAPMERRPFSLGATFLGWAVAAFFTLVFLAIAGIVLGAAYLEGGADDVRSLDINTLGLANFAVYLVATFLAFVIGGYAAGRIALWDGVKHGLGTVGWAVLFALLAVLAGATLADDFAAFTNVTLDTSTITTGMIIGVVATLVAQLAGAALGGAMGERYHDRVHGIDTRRVGSRRTRGRPF